MHFRLANAQVGFCPQRFRRVVEEEVLVVSTSYWVSHKQGTLCVDLHLRLAQMVLLRWVWAQIGFAHLEGGKQAMNIASCQLFTCFKIKKRSANMSKKYLFPLQMYCHICEMFDHYCEKCTGNFVRNTSVMHFSCICSPSLRALTGWICRHSQLLRTYWPNDWVIVGVGHCAASEPLKYSFASRCLGYSFW